MGFAFVGFSVVLKVPLIPANDALVSLLQLPARVSSLCQESP